MEDERRLLDFSRIPLIILQRIGSQKYYVCKDEGVHTELSNLEGNSTLDEEEPEHGQIKEETEEPEHGQIKQEQEIPEPLWIKEEKEEQEHQQFKEEERQLCISQAEKQLLLKQETDDILIVPFIVKRLPNETEQNRNKLISQPSPEFENLDQEENNEEPGKRRDEQGENEKTTWQNGTADISKQTYHMRTHNDEKPFSCLTCGRSYKYRRSLTFHLKTHTVPQVVVNSGMESVLLPWRTPAHLPRDAKVEWKDEYNRTVHVYKKGSNQSEGQAQVYRNRTKMNENPLRTGDLSLTLKHPTDEDTNIYTCTVYDREGKLLKKKEVNLQVKVPKVVVDPGEKSFLLPCKTKVHLPEGATVEWLDGRDWKVYVYRPGSDQPEDQDWFYRARTKINKDLMKTGDFSLTLDHPTDKDTEIYTCTVYDKEREKILMRKQVKVKVKVPQVVVVSSEEDSFQLPCRTTDDLPGGVRVEWTDSRDRKVHVFEDGSDQTDVQNVFYSNRTMMDKDPLRTKDFSLTLKYLTDGDSNMYTCTVYDNQEKILMKKQVQLRIKVLHVKVEEGAESVQLPFKTTPKLPEDIKVEWRNRDGKIVHLYMLGSDHPGLQNQRYINRTKMNKDLRTTGDLSLTLTRPTKEDRGEYKCTVWTKGKVLRWKTFHLIIKGLSLTVFCLSDCPLSLFNSKSSGPTRGPTRGHSSPNKARFRSWTNRRTPGHAAAPLIRLL